MADLPDNQQPDVGDDPYLKASDYVGLRGATSLYGLYEMAFRRYSHDILIRWGLPADSLEATSIRNELNRTWKDWTIEQRSSLLRAVEGVAASNWASQKWRRSMKRQTVAEVSAAVTRRTSVLTWSCCTARRMPFRQE